MWMAPGGKEVEGNRWYHLETITSKLVGRLQKGKYEVYDYRGELSIGMGVGTNVVSERCAYHGITYMWGVDRLWRV